MTAVGLAAAITLVAPGLPSVSARAIAVPSAKRRLGSFCVACSTIASSSAGTVRFTLLAAGTSSWMWRIATATGEPPMKGRFPVSISNSTMPIE
jgi:hypothetical protein